MRETGLWSQSETDGFKQLLGDRTRLKERSRKKAFGHLVVVFRSTV